jgi:hypothetical protein
MMTLEAKGILLHPPLPQCEFSSLVNSPLLQNVGVVHHSSLSEPMNSQDSHEVPLIASQHVM